MLVRLNRIKLKQHFQTLGIDKAIKEFKMKTTSKLVVGMTVVMFTMPTWASSVMATSQVWTTTNGSAVVDGSGNPVRTIHSKGR